MGCPEIPGRRDASRTRPRLEVADVFGKHGDDFPESRPMSPEQTKVLRDIVNCRTAALGGHRCVCDTCGHEDISYNSCRNRHCPKCQGIEKRKWVQARLDDPLPVPYYHVVFTLPDPLFPMCLFNQELIYDLLFDCASGTLLTFGRDPKWLGAELGFFGVLHTWGQTLWHHPHGHFVVPGGGINPNGEWVCGKFKGKFLFPVRGLSKVFRRQFIEGLEAAYAEGKLVFPGELKDLQSKEQFTGWINDLKSKDWEIGRAHV